MTSNINIDTAIYQQQQTNRTVASLADDFTQFLNLLTTQLQNQDPLNPMDSSEFTNQLVQFSQVEQQINSNKKLDTLVQLQLANFFGSTLGYVGLDISYISSEFNWDGQNPVTFNYALDSSAVSSQMFVMNEKGEVVFSKTAETSAGAHEFVWDGKTTGGKTLEPGTYSMKIDALDVNGKKVTTTTVVSGRVKGVETQNGTLYLIVGERAVPLSYVIKAQEPPVASTATDTTGNTNTDTDTATDTTDEETV